MSMTLDNLEPDFVYLQALLNRFGGSRQNILRLVITVQQRKYEMHIATVLVCLPCWVSCFTVASTASIHSSNLNVARCADVIRSWRMLLRCDAMISEAWRAIFTSCFDGHSSTRPVRRQSRPYIYIDFIISYGYTAPTAWYIIFTIISHEFSARGVRIERYPASNQ